MSEKALVGSLIIGQSGGPSSVINCSAYGVIKTALDADEIMKVYGALEKYFPSWVGYNMAKCGGCIRACVSMLEKKGGCMAGRFHENLRTGKAWKMDR